MDEKREKRYALATRCISLEELIVTGVMVSLMIVWACLIEDKRLLFIPLFILLVCFICFIAFVFRYVTEPKIAIQADCNGIYFYYPKNKEIFIPYGDIVKVECMGLRNIYGRIKIYTKDNEFLSIRTYEPSDRLINPIRNLVEETDKEQYLKKIAIKQ